MYRIAICDDSKEELEYVSQVIVNAFEKKCVNVTTQMYMSALDLLNENRKEPFDIVFLDLDMPGIDGMETADRIGSLDNSTAIVFVTNHEELVYKAYRFKAIGFIRKKYLEIEINEILDIFLKEAMYKKQYLIFKDSGKSVKIKIGDIIYMRSKDHYIDVITTDENNKCVVRDSMHNIEKMYSNYGFIRVHSRYIVNYRYIYSLGKDEIVLTNNQKIPMSRGRVNDVKQMFQYYSRR